MKQRIIGIFLCLVLVAEQGLPLWGYDVPRKSFYEKSGWLDAQSNTLRRVAERGEQGAYDLYKNQNPSPNNKYAQANIHQANLTELDAYRTSEPYRMAKQIRDAFVQETDEEVAEAEPSAADMETVKGALAELMDLYKETGDYYPMVTQSVLEVSLYMLPLQQKYQLYSQRDLTVLKQLFSRILRRPAQCGQGSGYRLFCEGRADALEGFAQLAQTEQDAQLIADVLEADIQQAYIGRELLTGAAALLSLKQERLLDRVLAKAVEKEGETFWQKIDVFMTGWWIQKIQFARGRYLGNVSAAGVLPQMYGGADGNVWEELARLLYNDGKPSPASIGLLARYGLGSCRAEVSDTGDGKTMVVDEGIKHVAVECRTLLPFLVGALSSGVDFGGSAEMKYMASRVKLTPASFAARLYFSNVMGDLNAETELRLDDMLYEVFEREAAQLEEERKAALEKNRRLAAQIAALETEKKAKSRPDIYGLLTADKRRDIESIEQEIKRLEGEKVAVPSNPEPSLQRYTRQSEQYRRKERGQRIYREVAEVSQAVDMGLSLYYTLALPVAAFKGAKWAVSLKKGMDAARAGRINADVRRLAALSSRLKKIRNIRIGQKATDLSKKITAMIASNLRAENNMFPSVAGGMILSAAGGAQRMGRLSHMAARVPSAAGVSKAAVGAPASVSAPARPVTPVKAPAVIIKKEAVPAPSVSVSEVPAAAAAAAPKQPVQAVSSVSGSVKDPAFALSADRLNDIQKNPLLNELLTLQKGGKLSDVQNKEVQRIFKIFSGKNAKKDEDLLRLLTLNVPFLQKSPNTIWMWGEPFPSAAMLARKTPFGFPMNQIFRAQPFEEIAPAFRRGKENILFFNGHGYISQDGRWKGALVQAPPGQFRPLSTVTVDKVLAAAQESESSLTSVYIYSCQAGHIFSDLRKFFKKYPQAAQKTEWYSAVSANQPASAKPLPAQAAFGSAKKRLMDKLLLNITHNGAGLGARAWIKGREVYPLRASIKRLEREMYSLPQSEKAVLEGLKDNLQLLLNIADATDEHLLAYALRDFQIRYPKLLENCNTKQLVATFLDTPVTEVRWGLKDWPADGAASLAPFLQLKQEWVDYVAATAKEMFDILEHTPSVKRPALQATALRVRPDVSKELEYAASYFERTKALRESNFSEWRRNFLFDARIRDLYPVIEEGRTVMKNLQDYWEARGLFANPQITAQKEVMEGLLADMARFTLLEKQTTEAEKVYKMFNRHAGFETWDLLDGLKVTPKIPLDKKIILSVQYLQRLRMSRPVAHRNDLTPDIIRAIDWYDQLQPAENLFWRANIIPTASAMRVRLAELGKQKKWFSALQRKEYNALRKELYSKLVLDKEKALPLQNRLVFLPKAQQTPNTVFLRGDEFTPEGIWARRTPLGFFRPKFVQQANVTDLLRHFKPNQENVLLAHVHGGISVKANAWKGLLISAKEHPNLTAHDLRFTVKDLLEKLPDTRSTHTSIYINGCFSGGIIDDVLRLRKQYPEAFAKTDWFTTASVSQYSGQEVLPAVFAEGSVRTKLFDKVLQRMRYNGDALAARILLDGKEIYPLRSSVRRLTWEIKKASPEEAVRLRQLQKELSALRAVADARNERQLFRALLELENVRPGTVDGIERWVDLPRILGMLPGTSKSPLPHGFRWGINPKKTGDNFSTQPYIFLQQEWVDYVAKTAEEIFRKAAK